MSKRMNSFTFLTRVVVAWLCVLVAGFGYLHYRRSHDPEVRQSYACAAGIQKAMDAIKAKGYDGYPTAEPGTREYDVHYAYHKRYYWLGHAREALLNQEDRTIVSYHLGEPDCQAVAANKDVPVEPAVIEKSEPPKPRPLTYEESVAKAHEDAARANAQIDKAMDDMLETYRKKAVSSKTHASGGSRADIFEMPDGTIVACRTTFKNGYRATTCD